MRLYKLTRPTWRTYGGCKWGPGVEHTAPGPGHDGMPLCTSSWLHAYADQYAALVLDPIHGHFGPRAVLWSAEGTVGLRDATGKLGCTRLKTLRRLRKPKVTKEMRIRFAVLCARAVCADRPFLEWARDWLSGADRSRRTAAATGRRLHNDTNRPRVIAYSAVSVVFAHGDRQAVSAAPLNGYRRIAFTPFKACASVAVWASRCSVAQQGCPLDLTKLARKAVRDERRFTSRGKRSPGRR